MQKGAFDCRIFVSMFEHWYIYIYICVRVCVSVTNPSAVEHTRLEDQCDNPIACAEA